MPTVKTNSNNARIRWMEKRDLRDVIAIEEENSCMSNPIGGRWDEDIFIDVLKTENNTAIVAVRRIDDSDVVVGFCIYELMGGKSPNREVDPNYWSDDADPVSMRSEESKIHIHNLVVRKDFENKGVGSDLLGRMKSKIGKRRKTLELDIRESNLRAQLFLRKHGFKAVSVVRNWYEYPEPEDAYKFSYTLEE